MTRSILTSLVLVCCAISINSTATAQLSRNKPFSDDRDKHTEAKSLAEDDTTQLAEARLAFAIQLVSSLADEARTYKDEPLRVRIQARAADVLWKVDRERARTLFARAWEAADTVDKDGRRKNEEERKRFHSGRGGTGVISMPPNLRAEVLHLAALHDRKLAENFLAKMEEDDKRNADETNSPRQWDPTQPPEAIAKRLQLARQILENGETERALLFAEPGLNRVTSQGIIFLVLLRNKNAVLADQRFSSLLERTASDRLADATSVSLLSSYVLTPSVLVTSTRNGVMMNPWTTTLPPPQLAPALRARFFSIASQILLRPASPEELDLTSAGLSGTSFTISRLLPVFEQNAPEMAAALQARLNALTQGATQVIPEQQRSLINAGFNSKDAREEQNNDPLARIERASSTIERDHLYAMAARANAMKSDPKAREFADKIEDTEMKKSVRGFVDFILVSKALEKRESEKALQLARTGELSHFQRAWAYTEIAALLKSSLPEAARELISESITEAGRIEVTSPENAEAWVAIARRTPDVDQARRWENALEAIKVVNKVADFTGEENEVSIRFQSRNDIVMKQVAAPTISLANLFGYLAEEDIYRTADIARNITAESPRAVVLLMTARSAFEKKLNNKR
jgi:hypothetical protein